MMPDSQSPARGSMPELIAIPLGETYLLRELVIITIQSTISNNSNQNLFAAAEMFEIV